MQQPLVIAYHLIWTAYGWWLPNDPRGSGSKTVDSDVIAQLGELHHGRKRVQPPGSVVREFYESAAKLLRYPLLKLDDAVSAVVEKLKAKGLTSPYLRSFVVARVNYTRFSKAESIDFDEALDKITASAQKFNVDRVNQQDVAKAGGGGPIDED